MGINRERIEIMKTDYKNGSKRLLTLTATLAVAGLFSLSANAELTASSSLSSVAPDQGAVTNPVDHSCDGIRDRLLALQSSSRRYHNEVARIADDTSSVMWSWYSTLSTDEGRTLYIPYGRYDLIRQSAQTSASNANAFRSTANGLEDDLSSIIADLALCKLIKN
jgi:hypothetical protein